MQTNQLNRVMRLVRRTGDTMVVLDQSTDEVMVLMNIDSYEGLLDQRDDSLEHLAGEMSAPEVSDSLESALPEASLVEPEPDEELPNEDYYTEVKPLSALGEREKNKDEAEKDVKLAKNSILKAAGPLLIDHPCPLQVMR